MLLSTGLAVSALLLPLVRAVPTAECPLLGPMFPANFDISSTKAFEEGVARFESRIEKILQTGTVNGTAMSFAIDVFSTSTNSSIYSYFHSAETLHERLTAGELNDGTIMRIGSVSKLHTVYALLVAGGMEVFNTPVTDILPELAGNPRDQPLLKIVWEDVTLGALASHTAGAGGFRFLALMKDRRRPVAPIGDRGLYADGGFGVLTAALARMTNSTYSDALQSILAEPLGLNGTSVYAPTGDDLNALRLPGVLGVDTAWEYDNQVSAGSGGVYTNTRDLRTLGLSILNSQLLDPVSTRSWMKPRVHTSALTFSIGAPWEINRLHVPVSPNSTHTRVTDLYTKLGGQPGYSAVFALSPDHGLGFSVLVAGPNAGGDRFPLRNVVGEEFVTAAEHAAAENAASNFAGTFALEGAAGTNLTLAVDADSPALGLEAWFVDGVDWRANLTAPGSTLPGENVTVRLYPMGLVSHDGTKLGFRAAAELVLGESRRAEIEGGRGMFDMCLTWFSVDFYMVGDFALDDFVLEVVDGRVESVEHKATGIVMRRVE